MKSNRREFLKDATGASAAMAAAPLFIPASARGANDRPAYGLIGAGNRGRGQSGKFLKLGAECVAICDVYDLNRTAAQKDAPNAKVYLDYHELLAKGGVDCVLIATPDHQHCPMLLAAVAAGKDVYLEKPMSHSLEESRKMVEAVRKTKQIVQIGMQRRSMASIEKAQKLVDEGVLGEISMVRATWNWDFRSKFGDMMRAEPLPGELDWPRFLGSAPKRPLEPKRFRWWRAFWDYSGGNMTDQGTHLMDCVQRLTKTTGPVSAICSGQVRDMKGAEAPDVFTAVFEYPNFMASWTLDYCNTYPGISVLFQGKNGTLVMDGGGGFQIFKEPRTASSQPIYSEPAAPDQHVENFLDCIKSRREPNCPVELGAQAVSGPHLANIAYHKRREARLDANGKLSLG
jgi:predicted dehydrogenase